MRLKGRDKRKGRKEPKKDEKERSAGSVGSAGTGHSHSGMYEALEESRVLPDVDPESFRCPPAGSLYDSRGDTVLS